MEEDFIYWKHPVVGGIEIEEITGGNPANRKLWLEYAYQIFCEHGKDGAYRELQHLPSGAPLLENENKRISITHTRNLLAIAAINKKENENVETFNPENFIGIDAEPFSREQVLRVTGKFLNEKETQLLDADDLKSCILAWTIKEAVYKAALTPGLNYKEDIIITKMPEIDSVAGNGKEAVKKTGTALLRLPGVITDNSYIPVELYSYVSEMNCITLAFNRDLLRKS